jgi:hypothetical protein
VFAPRIPPEYHCRDIGPYIAGTITQTDKLAMRPPNKQARADMRQSLQEYAQRNADRISALSPEFAEHIRGMIEQLRDNIDDGHSFYTCNAFARSIHRTLTRMESGEIVALIGDSGYQIASYRD